MTFCTLSPNIHTPLSEHPELWTQGHGFCKDLDMLELTLESARREARQHMCYRAGDGNELREPANGQGCQPDGHVQKA